MLFSSAFLCFAFWCAIAQNKLMGIEHNCGENHTCSFIKKSVYCVMKFRITKNTTLEHSRCLQSYDYSTEYVQTFYWHNDLEKKIYLDVSIYCRTECVQTFKEMIISAEQFRNILNSRMSADLNVSVDEEITCACIGKQRTSECSRHKDSKTSDCKSALSKGCVYKYKIADIHFPMFDIESSCSSITDLQDYAAFRITIVIVNKSTNVIETYCRDRDMCNTGNFELYLAQFKLKLFEHLVPKSESQLCNCNDPPRCPYIARNIRMSDRDACIRIVQAIWNGKTKAYDITSSLNFSANADPIVALQMEVTKEKIYIAAECKNEKNEGNCTEERTTFEKYCIKEKDNSVRRLWSSSFVEPSELNCLPKDDASTIKKCAACQATKDVKGVKSLCIIALQEILFYKHQRSPSQVWVLKCKSGSYCNDLSKETFLDYACPWNYDSEEILKSLNWDANSSEAISITSPESCPCNERHCKDKNSNEVQGKCTFGDKEKSGVCYLHFVHLNLELVGLEAEGCDVANDSEFYMRRSIFVFDNGRVLVKFECRTKTCLTISRQNMDCFKKNITIPHFQGIAINSCPCTEKGMQTKFKSHCINNKCTFQSIYALFPERRVSVSCSHWDDESEGCFVDEIVEVAPIVAQVLMVVDEDGSLVVNTFRTIDYLTRNLAGAFGCDMDKEKEYFMTTTAPNFSSFTQEPQPPRFNPDEVLGPVAAVVTVFLSIVNVCFIFFCLHRIYKIERRWADQDRVRTEKKAKLPKMPITVSKEHTKKASGPKEAVKKASGYILNILPKKKSKKEVKGIKSKESERIRVGKRTSISSGKQNEKDQVKSELSELNTKTRSKSAISQQR